MLATTSGAYVPLLCAQAPRHCVLLSMFVFLGFVLALVPSHLSVPSFLHFEIEMFTLFHFSWEYIAYFVISYRLTANSLPDSEEV